jgi:hypothetical protein
MTLSSPTDDMIEWEYHENETSAGDLKPPTEMYMDHEVAPMNPSALISRTAPHEKPPDNVPVAGPNSKSSIRPSAPILCCVKRRTKPPGQSSKGITALSIWGKLSSPHDPDIQLWLDSGADITLISEECYRSLKIKPRLRQGMKLKLWALTNNARILGYINLSICPNQA